MKFCLDRVENGIAVCLCEDAGHEREPYEFAIASNAALGALPRGMLFEAELSEDGLLRDLVVLAEETEERRARNKARLQALFARGKQKK